MFRAKPRFDNDSVGPILLILAIVLVAVLAAVMYHLVTRRR